MQKVKNFKKKANLCSIHGAYPNELCFGYDEEHHSCVEMKYKLVAAIQAVMAEGCFSFASTLEQGVPMWGAEACAAINRLGGNITFTAAPTSENQSDRWHPELRRRYFSLLEAADRIITPRYGVLAEELLISKATRAVILGEHGGPRIAGLMAIAENAGIEVIIP